MPAEPSMLERTPKTGPQLYASAKPPLPTVHDQSLRTENIQKGIQPNAKKLFAETSIFLLANNQSALLPGGAPGCTTYAAPADADG